MSTLATTDELFQSDGPGPVPRSRFWSITPWPTRTTENCFSNKQSESVSLDDGQIKTAGFDTSQGFGLRAVAGEATGYAHASELSEAALLRALETATAVQTGHSGKMDATPRGTNQSLYRNDNPLGLASFEDRVALLGEIDLYARSRDSRVKQVSASIGGSWQAVQIIRAGDSGSRTRVHWFA